MAKLAAGVVAVAVGFSLQVAASGPVSPEECIDLTGSWYAQSFKYDIFDPYEVVQTECSFKVTITSHGMVYNGTVDGRNVTLDIPGTEIGSHVSTSVAADGQEISWSWEDTWQRDCPAGLSGEWEDSTHVVRWNMVQHRCTLELDRRDGNPTTTSDIREGFGIFSHGTQVGELLTRVSLTWDGVQLKMLRATPCLDHTMFAEDAVVDGHCSGDETNDPSEKMWCINMGCHWEGDSEEDLCHCDSQDLCERNNFKWELRTCSSVLSGYNHHYGWNFDSVYTWNVRPEVGGSVTGEYDRCIAEEEYYHSMAYLSSACCHDRMSICDVLGQPKATPCFDPADFNPEATIDGHCAGDETEDLAQEDWCHDMGCHWDDNHESRDRCHCHTQELCENNGFTWVWRTCAEHASWLPPLPALYVYQTTEHGRTSGAMDKCKHDEPFSGMVHWMGGACCNGKASICDVPGAPSKCISIPRHSYEQVQAMGWHVDQCAAAH